MKQKKLRKAPLQEVIFQLTWKLAEDKNGIKFDPDFEIAIGLFSRLLADNYPVQKRLIPPHELVTQESGVVYQFRQHELQYPIIQIGHGILTVNDTDENYVWEDSYRAIIKLAVEALRKSYNSDLSFNSISLQYIDAVETPDEFQNPNDYINSNFNINVSNTLSIPQTQVGLALSQTFEVSKGLYLRINIHSGANSNTNKNAIIWSIQALSKDSLSQEELFPWLDRAHDLTSNTFVDMLKPHLYENFN